MKKIKILHAADFHFDTPFKDVGENQSKINREELKEVFTKVINICINEAVDILLLAGDIFDNYTVSKETLYFIEESLKKIENTKVFISPGNHDPYSTNSFYKLINWPSCVHIFKGSIEKVELNELGVCVWGAAFNDKYIRKSMLENFKCDEEKINLMVMHGEIAASKDGNEYNPITINEIQNSNLDYIALGHRHSFSGIQKSGNTYYAYSGCPQGRGFDELHDKGIIFGYVSKGIVDLDFLRISKRNYEEVEIDLSNVFTHDEAANIIINSIEKKYRKNNFYKIILKGEVSREFYIDEKILLERIKKEFYFCKIINNTKIKLNLEEITKGYSVKSIFAKKLINKYEELESQEEKECVMMALKLGISSLSDGEVSLDDY